MMKGIVGKSLGLIILERPELLAYNIEHSVGLN